MTFKVSKIILDGYISRDCLLSINDEVFQVKFCLKNNENKWVTGIVPVYDSLTWHKMKKKYARKGDK